MASEGGVIAGIPLLHDEISRFFMQATIIVAMCRVLSLGSFFLKEPRVIFEIIGGILLGPSALGRSQTYLHIIFPSGSLSYLDLVAKIGLTLYLFMVGLELDPGLLMSHAKKAGGVAIMGMAVPFSLGIGVSRIMFDVLQGSDPKYKDVSFTSFYVFIGTALSITAFPVLARLLKEMGLIYTRPGSLAMGAAALNDAVAWCLLVLAISIANSGNMKIAAYVFLSTAALALGLFIVIRPIFAALVSYVESKNNPTLSNHLFALTLCLVFMCAFTTNVLGTDSIFGAFLFGLIVPRGSKLFHECVERIEEFVATALLPIYFALSGLKTDVTTISSGEEWGIAVLVILVAVAGKFIGAGVMAYLGGMTILDTAVVAVLMNTRGLVELIVLNLGVNSGILSTRTFSVMVIMTLVTTFMTGPLIELIYPPHLRVSAVKDDKQAERGMARNEAESEAEQTEGSTILDSSELRLGVVVDMMEQLQHIINVLGFLTPKKLDTGLAVTAMRLVEPSLSHADEFLAHNESGLIVRVDEEPTDLVTAMRLASNPTFKKPELLPLSMFCHAFGTAINAFRIQGNPDDFPDEMELITKTNECNVILMPWRPSVYLQKLFWSTLYRLHTPVVLMIPPLDEARSRSRTLSGGRKDSGADQGARPRTNTLFGALSGAFSEVPLREHDTEIQLYSNIPNTVVPLNAKASVSQRMRKVGHSHVELKKVAVVLSGQFDDLAIYPLLERFIENALIEVHLVVAFKVSTLSEEERTRHERLMQQVEGKLVQVHHWDFVRSAEELVEELHKTYYHTIICSSQLPKGLEAHSLGTMVSVAAPAAPPLSESPSLRHPSKSMSGMGAGIESTEAHGANGQASYPELGVLGNLLREDAAAKKQLLLITHESASSIYQRRASRATVSSANEQEYLRRGTIPDLESGASST